MKSLPKILWNKIDKKKKIMVCLFLTLPWGGVRKAIVSVGQNQKVTFLQTDRLAES